MEGGYGTYNGDGSCSNGSVWPFTTTTTLGTLCAAVWGCGFVDVGGGR